MNGDRILWRGCIGSLSKRCSCIRGILVGKNFHDRLMGSVDFPSVVKGCGFDTVVMNYLTDLTCALIHGHSSD